MDKIFETIYKQLENIPVIDTHEHLNNEELRNMDNDIFQEYLQHYFVSDLVSSGLSQSSLDMVMGDTLSVIEKWDIVEPYFERCKLTGYGRALEIAVKGLYNIDGFSKENIQEINYAFKKTQYKGRYGEILKKCNIKRALVNVYDSLKCDRKYFCPVFQIDPFVLLDGEELFNAIKKACGLDIFTFDQYLLGIDIVMEKAVKKGTAAFKCAMSYNRTLKVTFPKKEEAKKEFESFLKRDKYEKPKYLGRNFQDYVFNYILSILDKQHSVLQIHTGMHEGNGNIMSNSNPELLTPLFIKYPYITFDLFHCGYPYVYSVGVLAKQFPNVYIDMCWAHIISPISAIRSLHEWLQLVPISKISAFGGDYLFIDGVYGHLLIAKENVSRALAVSVSQNLFKENVAVDIAKKLFYENPKNIFV